MNRERTIYTDAFLKRCSISHRTFKRICEEVENNFEPNNKKLKDILKKDRSINLVDDLENKYQLSLDHRQRATLQLSNTTKFVSTFLWLENIFKFIGESKPNINEVHLDSGTKRKRIGRNTCK